MLLGSTQVLAQQPGFSIDELLGKVKLSLFGDDHNLRKQASDAFVRMQSAAKTDGISIYSLSSYRSYAHQNWIWERKFAAYTQKGLAPPQVIKAIILYSAIPGTSRHHWGTDLDVIDHAVPRPPNPLLEKHYQPGGVYGRLGQWLRSRSHEFGFYEAYTRSANRSGFAHEPWHLSFRDLAVPMLEAYLKIDLKSLLQSSEIMGSAHFTDAFIQSYRDNNIKSITSVRLRIE